MDGISSIASAAQLLKMFGNARVDAGTSAFPSESSSANSAATNASARPSLPSSTQISMEMLLALQSDDPPRSTTASVDPSTPEDNFLREAHKSPMQRLREQILDSMGLTEDQLAQMSPEERRAAEDRIAQLIREKIREANGIDPSQQQNELTSALQQFA